MELTFEWHKAIKLNYKNTRNNAVIVRRIPNTIHDKEHSPEVFYIPPRTPCIYIYIHIYVHTSYMHILHTYVCSHTCMHTYIRTHISASHVHTTHAFTRSHTHICKHSDTSIHKRKKNTCTLIHTYAVNPKPHAVTRLRNREIKVTSLLQEKLYKGLSNRTC
jgi:hypothetical protein